jgi:hypothetical protein
LHGVAKLTKSKDIANTFIWIAGVSLLAGFFYWLTASRSVGYIDSGELATACYYLGIPHPTGYPLYANLGKLATVLLPGAVIWRCILLSLILTAASAGVMFSLIKKILPSSKLGLSKYVAASISLFIALSPVWWSQGTGNEVYCLTLLTNLLAILCLVQYATSKFAKHLIIGFYLWGLAFCVHMSSIFLLPAIAFLTISTDGLKQILRPRYIWALAFFVFALSFYIYLPIRAGFGPFLNWSNASSFQGLLNHVSGWQYRVWMFKSLAKMFQGIAYFGKLLYQQFGIVGIFLIITGGIKLFVGKLKLAGFFVLIILADIFYSANYEIIDIESYYLLTFASFAIFAAVGLASIIESIMSLKWVKSNTRWARLGIIICLIALPVSNLSQNYSNQDEGHVQYVTAGVTNIMNSMESNGIALIENWDFYSPWLYYHYIERIRPDAVLIDKELLRRSWYIGFLRQYHPDIMAGAKAETDSFLIALRPFESGKQYDSQRLTSFYRVMIDALVNSNITHRPIYANFAGDDLITLKQVRIPVGTLYKLEEKPSYISFDISKIDIAPWESTSAKIDKRARAALFYAYKVAKDRALFCHEYGKDDEAKLYIDLNNRIKAVLDRP